MDEQTAFLRTLADQMRGTADTLERIGTRLRAGPDPEPGPPPPPPPVDTGRPIWEQMSPPTVEIPAEVLAPAGQNVVWIPVTLEHTRMATVLMRTTRAINASPATINVGANGAAYLSPDLYRWSPGDDRTHYVRLAFPAPAYRDGQRLRIEMTLTGVDPRHRSRMVTVTFREGAAFPAMPAQRHRPARRLDLGAATRRGGFDPATLRATDSGFLADGTPTWRARPAQGHAPGGQGETGLYLTEEAFPGQARTPVTHDAAERALRLHAARLPEGRDITHQGRAYRHQAAMIQGQTLDALCGSEGVWRMVARMPAKRFTWPGFRLVGRGPLGRAGGPGVWPPQIDIMHQPDLSHATQPITGFDLHWGQQYGEVGSGQRRGTLGAAARMDELAGATQRLDAAYHSYACAVVWTGEDAEVTFFFDDREIGCARLFARHQDMRSRVEFAPVAQVAVRAPATATAADWEADGGSADMLIRDIAHYPSGFALV